MRFRFGDLFYGPLAGVLVSSHALVGPKWAWRVTRFAHSLPFGLGAGALGYLAGAVWQVPGISPVASGVFCVSGFYVLAAWDWVKDWRRG